MRKDFCSVATIFFYFLVLSSSTAQEFKPLFNGKNLDGWVQRGGAAKYRAEDNQIVGTTVPKTGNSFLCTPRDYTNFNLELQFKVHPKLNSGVQIRSQMFEAAKVYESGGKTNRVPAGRVYGYQVEIDPSPPAPTRAVFMTRGVVAGLQT